MAASGILRPGHVALRVMDMSAALKHYTQLLGLQEVARDSQGRVFLKAWDEWDHHSVVLRETDQAGMDYMGWRVASAEILQDLARDIQRSQLVQECRWIDADEHPQTGERFRFTIGTGHVMELYAHKEVTGTAVGNHNPEAWPEQGMVGMAPNRFDHCLLYGSGFDDTVKLFREILQFDLAEQVVTSEGMMVGAFFTCSNKAHDVAFIRHHEQNKLHHVSFYLDSW
ncbi:MAG: VOC family protein, partial [Enterobacteriaceae bacterium]